MLACRLGRQGNQPAAGDQNHGIAQAEAHIKLQAPEPDVTKIFSRPTVNLRYFPRLAASEQDRPAVDELVMSLTDDLRIADMWTGEGDIRLPEAAGKEMHMLAPVRTGLGFRCSMSYSVTDLKTLQRAA